MFDLLFFSAFSAPSAVNPAHLQARALYEALGRSLGSLSRQAEKSETQEPKPEGVVQEPTEKS